MPLIELSAEEAVNNRKTNAFASWGERNGPNRVEPIAKPAFDVPFQLRPGEKIFTVGSCFARNVETELMKRGFHLPMRDIFKKTEFQGVELGAINNFGTPSIFNEFSWAFESQKFEPQDHILEIQKGKFADIHLVPSMRPEAWDVVLSRRLAITEAFRSVAQCRVLIITLGLVEVWFDSKTGYYLNSAPRPSLIRNEPERFKLHVLSFQECYKYLEKALSLVKKHGRPDLQVLLTVSPVPLMTTHRMQDVMVANTYSKSVLRAVAESIVAKHRYVTYYPSYESVSLSDRRFAWKDDLVHVSEEIVALNVGRMIDAYIANDFDLEDSRNRIAAGGASVAVEMAQSVRKISTDIARSFFEEFGTLTSESVEFTIEYAGFLTDLGEVEGALAILNQAPMDSGSEKISVLKAEALIALGRSVDAVTLLEPLVSSGTRSYAIWNALLRSAIQSGSLETAQGVLARWSKNSPNRAGRANMMMGKWRLDCGDLDGAQSYLQSAMALLPDDGVIRISLAEVLTMMGKRVEAQGLMRDFEPANALEVKLFDRIRPQLT